jgi:hypothetical protein
MKALSPLLSVVAAALLLSVPSASKTIVYTVVTKTFASQEYHQKTDFNGKTIAGIVLGYILFLSLWIMAVVKIFISEKRRHVETDEKLAADKALLRQLGGDVAATEALWREK